MADLSTLLKRIRGGEVDDILEDVQKVLSSCSGTVETQQLIRHCSRYIYEQPSVSQAVFSQVVDVINVCCKHQHGQAVADSSFHLKSMYYIILMASKRKDLHQYLAILLCDLEQYVSMCDVTKGDMHTIVKNLYQSVWNASLAVESSLQALTLQQHALIFLLASGASIVKVCDQAMKILFNYEHVNKSLEHAQDFCLALIANMTQGLKKIGNVSGEILLAVMSLVMQYAKSLISSGKCAEFSKITRPLMSVLEGGCNQQTIMALKFGFKLPEVGMALKVGKCQEQMMLKFIQSCSIVPNTPISNNVVLLSLLCTTGLFETQNKKDITYSLSPQVMGCIVDNLLLRCVSPITEETTKKVATVLCYHLGGYVEMLKTSSNHNDILKQAVPWVVKTNTFIITYCKGKPDTAWQIYNVGVNSGNLGVLAFKGNHYELSPKFLETSVEMFLMYYALVAEDQKISIGSSLHKKLILWSDALRYGGSHWEAAVAAARGMLIGHVKVDDAVAIWVKCKRDAEKAGNTTLRGLTICDVVRGAVAKYRETVVITFDGFAALNSENVNYKKQSHDTIEDQLFCGRAMLDYATIVDIEIHGLLVIVQSLWIQPSLCSQKDEAIQTVKKVITVIAETKSKGQYTNRLRELEAVSYFWLYLCHLQQIQDTAAGEVHESEKPISLSVQATDLGEEVQEDDACDVRPTPTCLTLYAQETSLEALHIALSLWEKIDALGVTLEEEYLCYAALASAGYVYQLAGIVNPAVRAWTTLVSLARRHSNALHFVKGVTELLLVVPELVPCELVNEAQEMAASLEEDKTHESVFMYVNLSFTAAVAYYHLKHGQYEKGGLHLKEAFKSELMEKRTIRATEIQGLVHYVASLYAWLPPWVMEVNHRPTQPCITLAMLACRQAMAVLKSSVPISHDILCWRHRVGCLHLTTTLWLGHLCQASAQPRLARTYLKQSLTLTQELALPLRTGELLQLLARVDLLCDQLDDCLVKVDSLLGLLVTHPSNPKAFSPMTRKANVFFDDEPPNSKEGSDQPAFHIFSNTDNNEEEKMRTCNNTHEYDLKSVNFNTGLIVVGPEERVSHLAVPQAPPSPSLRYREEASIVHFASCPKGDAECGLCSTPAIHQLRMSAAVLLAYIHAHKGRFGAAKKNLDKFKEMYSSICKKTSSFCSQLSSLMNNNQKNKSKLSPRYIHTKINLVHLESLHCEAEVLALEDNLEQALDANIQALKTINSLDSELLLQDMQFVTTIILQRYSLQRSLDLKEDEIQIIDERKAKTSDPFEEDDDEEEVTVIAYKTPSKFFTRGDRKSSTRTSRRIPIGSRAPRKGTRFNILSDDDDDDEDDPENDVKVSSSEYKKRLTKTGSKQASKSTVKFKTTCPSPTKLNLDVNEMENQFSNLSIDNSPDRHVLKVPNTISVSPHSILNKSSRKGVEDIYFDDSKGIENACGETSTLTKSNTERKKRGGKKVKELAVPSVLIFSDKDSPIRDDDGGSDDLEPVEKRESKPTRGRPRKPSEEKNVKVEINKATATNSSLKSKSESKTRPKTRSSRTIR